MQGLRFHEFATVTALRRPGSSVRTARISRAIALPAIALCLAAVLGSPAPARATPAWVDGEVVVKFKDTASPGQISAILSDLGATRLKRFERIHASHERISGIGVAEAIGRYRNHPAVELIEPNYIYQAEDIPNDPRFPELWGMRNVGQTGGTPGADIRATLAWDVFTGSSDVVVGVIDTGVDYTHPDLAANIWTNPGEIPGNGLDDDANGFVDDVRGWDFINHDNDPMDDNGHGTHVSGTIGGVGDNGLGVAGVTWHVRIMPIKFLSSGGSGSLADAISSIEYATQMGVRIMSNSWGGGPYTEALRLAIQNASDSGILFVAAAGNSGSNNDSSPHYPSNYDVPNVIAVAATDHNDQLAGFSSYGPTTVDLAAPGVDILSTFPSGGYGTLSGTSMATPHVAGTLALLLGRFPGMTMAAAKTKLLISTDPLPSLAGYVATGGRLNAFLTLADPDETPPDAITDLAITEPLSDGFVLRWTAPADAGPAGRPARYEVYYAPDPFDESNYAGLAAIADGAPEPLAPGSIQTMDLGGLIPSTRFWVGIVSIDQFGNRSLLSNVADALTLGAPRLSLTPLSFTATLLTGGTDSQNLTLSNVGEGTLDFDIVPQLEFGSPTVAAALDVAKGGTDPREGILGSGGPDRFGYQWSDSDQPGGPVFEWVEISGVGTPVGITGDDYTSSPIPIGFGFPFYGSTFTTVRVSTNGFLSFTSASAQYTNQPLPSTGAPENLIAPFWDDLYFVVGSAAYTYYDGTRFIVEYKDVHHYVGGGPYTFQVILEPGGTIHYQYLSMGSPLADATVGIQDATMTDGLTVAFNTPYVRNGLAVRLAAMPNWLSATPASGRVHAPGSEVVQVGMNATDLLGGTYHANLRVLTNDMYAPETVIPVTLTVEGAPDIEVSAAALDFGSVFVGGTSARTLIIRNRGTDYLDVSAVSSDSPEFEVSSHAFIVSPRSATTLTLTFRPTAAGDRVSVLRLASNDPDEPETQVALNGVGVPPPQVGVAPASISADLLSGETATRTVTVSNTGGSNLEFSVTIRRVPVVASLSSEPPAGVPSTPAWTDAVAAGRQPPANPIAPATPPSTAALPSVIADPAGDGGPVDITALNAASNGADLEVELVFATTVVPTDMGGYLSLDVDRNRGTGYPPSAGRPAQDIGAEFEFNFFSLGGGYVNLYDLIHGIYVGSFTATIGAHTVRFRVPLAFLGGDDGEMDVTGVIGNAFGPTDWFPDAGHGTIQAVPWLTVTPLSGTVPPGGSIDLTALFDPGRLTTGVYNAEILVGSNDPDDAAPAVAARLGVTGVPVFQAAPLAFDFGGVFVGGAAEETLVVRNTGTETLFVTSVSCDNADFAASPPSFGLLPDSARVVRVQYLPSSAGPAAATLTIVHNAAGSPALIPLAGEGVPPPVVAVSPESMSADLLTGQSETRILTITNSGASDLTFQVARVAAPAAAFSPGGGEGPFAPEVHAPGVASTATIGPTRNVTNPTPGEPVVQAVYSGTHLRFGISEYGEIMPFQYPLGIEHLQVGAWVSGYTLAYVAGGVDRLAVAAFEYRTGLVPVSYREVINTPTRVEVEVVTRTSDGYLLVTQVFGFNRNEKAIRIEARLEAQATVPLQDVVWKCYADWDMEGSPGNDTWDFDRTRNMTVASDVRFAAVASAEEPDLMDLYGWGDYSRRETYIDYPVGPVYPLDGLEVLHFNLGSLVPGSTRMLTTAFGAGDNLAELQAIMDQVVPGSSWLRFSPAEGTVPPGGSASIDVTMDATGLYGGDYDAGLAVRSNDPANSEIVVPAHLHVTGVPLIAVTPTALDFGSPYLGQTVQRVFTVTNVGTDSLRVSGISSGDPSYTVIPTSFVLAPAGSAPVAVTFAPTTAGAHAASLSLTHNAAGSPTIVSLTGIGVEPPVVGCPPPEILSTLEANEQETQTFTLCNEGGSDLSFTISTMVGASSVVVHEAQSLVKGAPDTRVGEPVTEGQGGPDLFGYRWVDSDQPGGPPFQWVEISGIGTPVPIYGDDAMSGPISLGFQFPYYGNQYSTVNVCTNGFLSFTSFYPSYVNVPLPNGGAPENMLAAFWSDLWVGDPGVVYFHTDGTRAVVQYNNVRHLGGIGVYTFQMILYPNGTVLFQYLHMEGNTQVATVGIQNQMRNDGLTAAFNTPYVHDNLAIRFNAGPSWLSVDPVSGVIPPGASLPVAVTTDATDLVPGNYLGSIRIDSNDPARPSIPVPVRLHVIGVPHLYLSTSDLDFGTLFTGATATRQLTVANIGSDVLNVTSIEPSLPAYTAEPGSLSLAPLQSATVTVRFSSAAAGRFDGTLLVQSNDPDGPHTVTLRAEAVVPPDIGMAPARIETALPPGGSRVKPLTLCNTGGSDLRYVMRPPAPLDHAVAAQSYLALGKGEFDPREGMEGQGGPDGHGYYWSDSGEPGGPAYEWVDISGIGTPIPFGVVDDVNLGPFPIGFGFPFYDGAFTSFRVCSNGWISFTSSVATFVNQPLPNAGPDVPENLVAAFWDDLIFVAGSGAWYHNDGTRLIVQFKDVRPFGVFTPVPHSFEIILHPDGTIVYQYQTVGATFTGITVGVQNGDRNDGLTVSHGTTYLHSGMAVRITPPNRWLRVTPMAGTVAAGACADVAATLDASTVAPGDYGAMLYATSNDPDEPVVGTEVVLHVGLTDAADVDIDPNTLNLDSRGRYITGRAELPPGFDPGRVVLSSVRFGGGVPAEGTALDLGDFNHNGIPDLQFKFDRAAVEAILPEGPAVEVSMTGEVEDVTWFLAHETIRVIRPRILAPNGGESLPAGSVVTVSWEAPNGWNVTSAEVFYTLDGGRTWDPVAGGIQGVSVPWTLPAAHTDSAAVRVYVSDDDGPLGFDSSDALFHIAGSIAAAEASSDGSAPTRYALRPNEPNPFNPETWIRYDLPRQSRVRLRVYDARGRLVRTLVDLDQPAGRYRTRWDGRDDRGRGAASGLYYARITAGDFVEARRMLMLK